jgi:uncharacterized protein DUF4954/uncharacterized protein DUF6819
MSNCVTPIDYRPLTQQEIETLTGQGCTAADWSLVQVADGFDPNRVRNAQFAGTIRLGANGGTLSDDAGIEKPCGIQNASLFDCTVGDGVRITGVGVHIARYDIGDGACVEHVGTMETRPDATFGNGVEIEVLNEGGGREVVLFDRLDCQFAHLLCLHRYRQGLTEKLLAFAETEIAKAKQPRGRVAAGARVRNTKCLIDVNIGSHAVVDGAALLTNGTVLSSKEAPAIIGCDVQAEDFIIAEGSKVTGGAIVCKSYVGQGCQIGKQFSAEGSVFFANCEGFHGEACSIFAGPYTVTHHKSTLLIAGLFSFYNAGSGTNQSNHLYKLGPVHEGKLERGCKTGSFSYMMWPCRVGPFSVVLGKHTRTFDTSDFPFSYLEATPAGRCVMTPGFNFTTVGTVRDGAKWPARDRRRGVLRDRISFDVFSPLTVGRMIRGAARMKELLDKTDRKVDLVNLNGADVKRILLRTGQKFYRSAIHMYLLDKVLARAEALIEQPGLSLADAFAVADGAVYDEQWVDIGGQMMPRKRLDDLCADIVEGRVTDLDGMNGQLDTIVETYGADEWAWIRQAYAQVFEKRLEDLTVEDTLSLADDLLKTRQKFLKLVLNDASKEFDNVVRTGFGQDGSEDDIAADFEAVRGNYDTNKFVRQMEDELAALRERVEKYKQAVANR